MSALEEAAAAAEAAAEAHENPPKLDAAAEAHENPPKLDYGTAGFRCNASLLDVAMERVGMLAALRSCDRGGATGVMVTASHNGVEDNGVKIVDPSGGMLAMDWESKAEALARCPESQLKALLASMLASQSVEGAPTVVVGRDTRPHSPRLRALVVRGAELCCARVIDLGVVTTPQLHHCVAQHNAGVAPDALYGYTENLASTFKALVDMTLLGFGGVGRSDRVLRVDCAGGVGAGAVEACAAALRARGLEAVLDLTVVNGPGAAVALNEGCGAEFCQKERLPPRSFESAEAAPGRLCSLDGDADRLVYCYWRGKEWRLLDGDKIAALLAGFVAEELAAVLPLLAPLAPSVGVVQTAYANGAAKAYLEKSGVAVTFAKTGVKFVHHEAEKLDLGVYFEANGHGTVLFSRRLAARLAEVSESAPAGSRAGLAAKRLALFAELANQSVGDALADALLVESVLVTRGWDVERWDSIYEDLPSRQLKLPVRSRTAVRPNAAETRLHAPLPLQMQIDALARAVPSGRAFVRPSGTEDVVRVYAEAHTQAAADALAVEIARAVYDLAEGLGERP